MNALPRSRARSCRRLPLLALAAAALLLPIRAGGQDSAPAPPAEEEEEEPRLLFTGEDLEGWRVVEKFDFRRHGEVTVEDGVLYLAKGDPQTGISYTGEFPRMNYEVIVEAQRTEGSDFFCGMTFPVGDEYCTLIVGGWGGGIVGLSNINNSSAIENETTTFGDLRNDTWYRIRLQVTSERIRAWLDEDEVVDVPLADREFSIWWEQEPVRPFGIAAWNTGAAIRKVVLQGVQEEDTEEEGDDEDDGD